MPIPTPFHSRTSAICQSHEWRNWSGFLSAVTYEPNHDREYYAIRNSAGLLDVSPLFKYEMTGPDALRLVDRIMTRDITKCKVGQVMYSPWCDEDGKVIDDGTISRLEDNHFRITAADPSMRWFQDCGYGLNAEVQNVSNDLAALALQGPNARNILNEITKNDDLDQLKYFWLTSAKIDNIPLTITRTGYTGDLGYELWVSPKYAEKLWDCLLDSGRRYGILPAGLAALDVARIEAGLLLIEVDYISTLSADIESQKSSPFEIGLGWAVKFGENDFIGRQVLEREKLEGSKWSFIGLDINWEDLEVLFAAVDLPPQVAGRASRSPIPIYQRNQQIGQATSITFSPILKKYIAIGTIESQYVKLGDQVEVEITVEFHRQRANATQVKPKFFNPPRKRAITNA